MSTPEKMPTVTVNRMIGISDIDQDGLSQADDEEIISAFTEEYEKRLRNLLPGLDLHFEWKRAQGEKPKVNCNCWRLELDCEHEEDVKETLSLETPWLDALSAALESAEPEKVDLRDAPLTRLLREYMGWWKTEGGEHQGRWVVVHENGVIASHGSYETAEHAARKEGLNPEDYLIIRAYPVQPAISTWGA